MISKELKKLIEQEETSKKDLELKIKFLKKQIKEAEEKLLFINAKTENLKYILKSNVEKTPIKKDIIIN